MDKLGGTRLGSFASHGNPRILNMNQQVTFNNQDVKKKNKNDFYRFLLQQNLQ